MRHVTARLSFPLSVALLATAFMPGTSPVLAAGEVTGLSVMGDETARTWRAPDTTFNAPADADGTATVSRLTMSMGAGYPWNMINFGAAPGEGLTVGTYAGATSSGDAGPKLFINETGCLPATGSFEVLEIEAIAGEVVRLAFSFTYVCASQVSRSGEYRYNSNVPLQGPELAPFNDSTSGLRFGPVVGGTASAPQTVTLTNNGTAAIAVSGVALTGNQPGSFEIVGDACTGVSVAPAGACTVDVRATPPEAGGYDYALLTLTSDTSRASFGASLSVDGQTRTTLTITTPATVPANQSIELAAQVAPVQTNTLQGSVNFYLDGTLLGSGTGFFTVDGKTSRPAYLTFGPHELRAVYVPNGGSNPPVAPTEVTKTITAAHPVGLVLTSPWSTTVKEGTRLWFTATMTTSTAPSSGMLRIRNATAGTVLASKAITGTETTLSTPLVLLPVGASEIVAEFEGDPDYEQATATRTQTVVDDVAVEVSSTSASPTPFYPIVDGYRDTIGIRGSTLEPLTATIRIYNSSNQVVRTISIGAVNGPYATSWNGRTAGGTLVPAGAYRIRQTLVDAAGNTLHRDTSVSLSWRKVKWITTSISKYGASYSTYLKGGTGSISKSASSYYQGVRVSGGSGEGYAVVRYSMTLRSALAYKGLSIAVLGKGTTTTSRAILAFGQDTVGSLVGPGYQWWTRSGSVTGRIVNRVVLLDVEADGPMRGAFDVAKTKVTYTYAVWP